LALNEITLEKVIAGQLTFDDVKIRPETLEYQAQIAESAGRYHLAGNLRRATEITRIPDARVLEIYNALRPYRSTKQELLDIAAELENKYQAKICASFVREACAVYEKRNRIKK
jgi:propanediol dehydratase small subunit